MANIYFAADGDDIGKKIEYFIVMNQTELLIDFFNNFKKAMAWFESSLSSKFEATILFSGGDNLLATFSEDKIAASELEYLRHEFSNLAHATISIGIGGSPRQAYFALKFAKASGKNKVEFFRECNK